MEETIEKHATFTPGPWYAHGTTVSTWETQDEIDFHGNEVIAETGFNANARLIAAAPEMYEMCKLLEECMENIDGKDGWDASYELAKVREVLAKVEGGEG